MTTLEYLGGIERLNTLIDSRLEEVSQLRALATSISVHVKEIDVQTSSDHDGLASAVAKIVDYEREVDAIIDMYVDKKRKISKQISSMDDNTHIAILILRYIDCKSWNEIEEKLHYSHSHMMRIHSKALDAFEKKFSDTYKR